MKGARVLVTGADGFIGSHLVEALVREGALVRAFTYYNSFNSWGWLDTLSRETMEKVQVAQGDIRDPAAVFVALKDIDIVFHLAALISIPFSYEAPDSFVSTNITGTLNVLQAARAHGVKRVLVTSTSEVYGSARYVPIDENHPLQGQSPYSATKIAADRLAESFWRSFSLPVTIVRPFNTYGPRQSARAVIPTIITQLLSGVSELKLGRLDTVRDFNYVKDTARAFIAIAQSDKTLHEEINIATGTGVTIGETLATIQKILGTAVPVATDDERIRPVNSEVERLIGSNKKLTDLTSWTPSYTFEQGLADTIAWFKEPDTLGKYKAHLYNR